MALRIDLPGTCFRAIFVRGSEKNTVVFYDRDYNHTPDGQHTGASYYAETLLEDKSQLSTYGLDLVHDIDKWKVDGPSMKLCLNWLERCVAATQISEVTHG